MSARLNEEVVVAAALNGWGVWAMHVCAAPN
jgi:NO-binding membrane sensor protein with MHYT domain